MRPSVYNTGNFSEMISSLPVYQTGSVTKHTIFCVDLGSAPAAGEVLSIAADFEVTSELPYTVFVGSQIRLSLTCAGGGIEITEANGTNLHTGIHHLSPSRSGHLEVPAGAGQYVTLQAWSMAWSPQWDNSHSLIVEQDYGRMSVLRWS